MATFGKNSLSKTPVLSRNIPNSFIDFIQANVYEFGVMRKHTSLGRTLKYRCVETSEGIVYKNEGPVFALFGMEGAQLYDGEIVIGISATLYTWAYTVNTSV